MCLRARTRVCVVISAALCKLWLRPDANQAKGCVLTKFTSMVFSQFFSLLIPALLMTMSSLPKRSTVLLNASKAINVREKKKGGKKNQSVNQPAT